MATLWRAVAGLGIALGAIACDRSVGVHAPARELLRLAAPSPSAPATPGPGPRRRRFDAVAVNLRCEGCHRTIAAEWRSSLHRQSNTVAAYRRQFAVEPLPFCTRCHAPEAEPALAEASPKGDLGVSCVTCHVVQGRIVGHGTHAGAPHAVATHLDLRGADGCGGCHEFGFPSRLFAAPGLAMQSTMTEHAQSAYADRRCGDCHMPSRVGADGRRHADHRFLASRDPRAVRGAVVVEPLGWRGKRWRLRLRPGEVGHAFPTGDMLRQLTLTVEVRDPGGAVVDGATRVLKRHFTHRRRPHGAPQLHALRDDRVGAADIPDVFTFELERPAAGSLAYRLTYDRVADPRAAGGSDRYDGRITLVDEVEALPPPDRDQ